MLVQMLMVINVACNSHFGLVDKMQEGVGEECSVQRVGTLEYHSYHLWNFLPWPQYR